MNDQSGITFTAGMARLLIAAVAITAMILLIPILFQVVWSIMPGIAVIVLIFFVLRAMVKKLLE